MYCDEVREVTDSVGYGAREDVTLHECKTIDMVVGIIADNAVPSTAVGVG